MHKTVLSTADVARLFQVTETTVKRWADAGELRCQKTPGGHRKFDIRNVLGFASEYHLEPFGTLEPPGEDKLGPRIEASVLARDFEGLARIFVEKALSPDTRDLTWFLSYLYHHQMHLSEIYDRIVRPGMEQIGIQWERGEIGLSHEHRASYQTLDSAARLQTQVVMKNNRGKTVLCACPEEENHEIGLRCVANLFETEGWRVQYLGARVPIRSLIRAVQEVLPDVICVSVTVIPDRLRVLSALRQLYTVVQETRGTLVIGGRAAASDAGLADVCHYRLGSTQDLFSFGIINGNDLSQAATP